VNALNGESEGVLSERGQKWTVVAAAWKAAMVDDWKRVQEVREGSVAFVERSREADDGRRKTK